MPGRATGPGRARPEATGTVGTARGAVRAAAAAFLAALLAGIAPAAAVRAAPVGDGGTAASAGGAGSSTGVGPVPSDVPPLPAGAPPPGEPTFTDVAGSWAAGYIYQLQQAGVITVPADRLFRGAAPITRLDFAVWVSRALELPAAAPRHPFADEAQIPPADRAAVAAAAAAGLVQGYPDGDFAPSAPIDRAAIATIFGRALEARGETPDPRYFAIWADGSSIPAWALPATVVMKDQLMYGEPCRPEACFAPLAPTTRAEAAALLVRFLQYVTTTYHPAPLPPPPPPPPFQVEAWYSNTDTGYAQLQSGAGALGALIYTGYTITAGGQVVGYDSPRTLAWAAAHPATALWVMVSADSLSFLTDPAEAQSVVTALVAIVRRAGYAGVNLDVEGVPPADGAAFTAFVQAAAAALHAAGAKVSVDVPTETAQDLGQSWDAAYNYPALGAAADQVILMAYDYHSAGGPPGPISPLAWERAALAYATSAMPASKVVLGLPLYGYIWNTATDAATAYWESGMVAEAQAHGAAITRDAVADEATFTYPSGGATYVGWFVDGQGAADRIAAARRAGIGGICLWRLDYRAPDWWPVLAAPAGSSPAPAGSASPASVTPPGPTASSGGPVAGA